MWFKYFDKPSSLKDFSCSSVCVWLKYPYIRALLPHCKSREECSVRAHLLLSPEIKAVVGSGNQAERKIDIMDNFLDLGRSLVPDNLFQVIMVMRSKVLRQKMFAKWKSVLQAHSFRAKKKKQSHWFPRQPSKQQAPSMRRGWMQPPTPPSTPRSLLTGTQCSP